MHRVRMKQVFLQLNLQLAPPWITGWIFGFILNYYFVEISQMCEKTIDLIHCFANPKTTTKNIEVEHKGSISKRSSEIVFSDKLIIPFL